MVMVGISHIETVAYNELFDVSLMKQTFKNKKKLFWNYFSIQNWIAKLFSIAIDKK